MPADQVLEVAGREAALSFDAPGARYDHRDRKCTSEVLIDEHALTGNPALTLGPARGGRARGSFTTSWPDTWS